MGEDGIGRLGDMLMGISMCDMMDCANAVMERRAWES